MSDAAERVLEDIKVALRMPDSEGAASYVGWAKKVRDAYDAKAVKDKPVYLVAMYGHRIAVYDESLDDQISKHDDNPDDDFIELPGTDVGVVEAKWGGRLLGPFYTAPQVATNGKAKQS